MAPTLFKIVFEGQLRHGVERQTAQLNLAQLFNSDVAAVDKLFDGNPVALKRGLKKDDAEAYLKVLNDAGLDARIEADEIIVLNIDEVDGTPLPISPFAPPPSPYAPPRASVGENLPEHSDLKIFSFQGRIGRLRYLAWALVLLVAALLVMGLCVTVMSFSLVGGGLLIAVSMAVFAFISFQLGSQRLHDAGWSGWLLLLNLVPYLGSIFPLLMVVIPGNKTANRYGPPPPPNSRAVKLLAWMWILLIAAFIAAGITGGLDALQDELESTTVEYEQSLPDDNAVEVRPDTSAADSGLEVEDNQ
jgi:uncharacterized membrane protein YhaH (DUF805 family)